MSKDKTEHYGLNQWDKTDDFVRSEFNEDNSKIDTAIATKCEVVFGTYVGDDKASKFINLGFTPKAVLLCNRLGEMGYAMQYNGGLALEEAPLLNGTRPILTIEAGGFCVYVVRGSGLYINTNDTYAHHYVAFK